MVEPMAALRASSRSDLPSGVHALASSARQLARESWFFEYAWYPRNPPIPSPTTPSPPITKPSVFCVLPGDAESREGEVDVEAVSPEGSDDAGLMASAGTSMLRVAGPSGTSTLPVQLILPGADASS